MVQDIIQRTREIASVRVLPGYRFIAGQYFKVLLPEAGVFRCLSASSSPVRPYIEFTKRITGSVFSIAFQRLHTGQIIRISGPFGTFTGPNEAERALFIAGGIGITPIFSILEDHALTGRSLDAILLFANRTSADIPFRKEIDEIGQSTGLRTHYFLDAPEQGYCCGRITGGWIRRLVQDIPVRRCWVSGPPAMVSFVRNELQTMVEPARVVTEQLAGYADTYP